MCSAISQAAEVPVYIGSGADTGISQGILDTETGELKGVKLAVATSRPASLAYSGDKKTIYAIGRNKEKHGFVASFSVKDDGSLEMLGKQSSMGAGPCHVSVDKTSNALFVANYRGGSIASYQIGDKLSEAVSFFQHEGKSVHEKRQKGPHAHSIYSSPDNNMVFSEDGAKLYVLNELTLTISRFARDASSGGLTLEKTVPVVSEFAEKMTCSEIQLSSDGKYIYAATRDLKGDKRDVISVLSTEDMSIIQEQPAGVWIPRHFGISPSGKWFLIAGQKSNQVVIHARDPETGKLTQTAHSAEVKQPMWILFK